MLIVSFLTHILYLVFNKMCIYYYVYMVYTCSIQLSMLYCYGLLLVKQLYKLCIISNELDMNQNLMFQNLQLLK